MKTTKWIRARSQEKKDFRVKEIVSATAKLYENCRYEDISFASIAKELDFTRANLYKYFTSKEEIFLELLKNDVVNWRIELDQIFNKDKIYSIHDFSIKWVDTTMKNKRFLDLFSLLHLHLEKEASYSNLVNFKKYVTLEYKKVVECITGKIDGFVENIAVEFITFQAAICVGLYQVTNLSENQRKVLDKQEFSFYKIDFREKYIQAVKSILKDLIDIN